MTIRLVFAFLLVIVAIVAAICSVIATEEDYKRYARLIAVGTLLGAMFFGVLSCVRIVAPGEVGIPVTFGKTGTPFGAGIHVVNPFADVNTMSVRTEQYTMSISSTEGNHQGDDSVTVLGSDGATGNADATLLYHLNVGDASRVYRELGTGYVEKLIRPTARTCIRDAFAKNDMVTEATTGRGTVTTDIQKCIEDGITPHGINLENFQLRDVHLGQQVQDAINAKVSAQQGAEQQKFELQKTTQQAEIARVDAQGKADAQTIIACGGHIEAASDGTTRVVPNSGEQCTNSLSPAYLQYLYIQSLQKIAESQSNSTLIVPFDQALTPLLNVNPGTK